LDRLRWLDLSNNYLKSLPAGLDSLRQLAKLNLSFNQLTQLPIALGNIPTLKGIWYYAALTPFGTGTPNVETLGKFGRLSSYNKCCRSGLNPDSIESLDPDPGGQKLPQKKEKVNKFHILKCWMFSFEG
jgi:Leucine-rich repeat (LRR) protein